MRIAICEDTPMEAAYLLELLRRYQDQRPHIRLETDTFGSAEALLDALATGGGYDLYLLDIIMPGMDGMSMARALRGEDPRGDAGSAPGARLPHPPGASREDPSIIFLTSSPDFAVEAFRVKATDYLVKPVRRDRLFEALDDAVAALGSRVEPRATLPAQEGDISVKRADIVMVEVTGHTLTYLLAGGRRIVSKVLRIPFEQATADLLEDPRFFSPHRSFLINLAQVERLERDGARMKGGASVPVSRLRAAELRRAYAAYVERTSGG